MIINIILLTIAFIALVIGTITDIKTREVPDWVNFGLIFSALGIRLVYSSITFDWMFFVYGLFGLAVFVIIAYLMFYAGQWGGGDSKLLMGLGALIGLKPVLQPIPLLLILLVNILLIGAFYGLFYSIALAIIHKKSFIKNFKKIFYSKKIIKTRKLALLLSAILVILIIFFIKELILIWLFIALALIAYLSLYLIIFIKAVELSSMYKFIAPEQLTEGDWIAKKYFVDSKYICGPKDLGISKAQIRQLINLKKKRKIKKIKVKYGIPFVPSFLIAFIVSFCFGAWWVFLF